MADRPAPTSFRAALVRQGLLIPLGADGVYGHGAAFEGLVEAIQEAVSVLGSDHRAAAIRLPPVYPAADCDRTGYPENFPHLGATVAPRVRDADARSPESDGATDPAQRRAEGRSVTARPGDLALVPAACHPVYALHRGADIAEGRVIDVLGQCFRREPSQDPFRMQAFRQREYVYLGDGAGARAHQERWVVRSLEFLDRLGLNVAPAAAADPFFGRGGRLLAVNQLDTGAKTEVVVTLPPWTGSGAERTEVALVSCNYHGDHFGLAFGIQGSGVPVHTACVGFGVERLALALLYVHGLRPEQWPGGVQEVLRR